MKRGLSGGQRNPKEMRSNLRDEAETGVQLHLELELEGAFALLCESLNRFSVRRP